MAVSSTAAVDGPNSGASPGTGTACGLAAAGFGQALAQVAADTVDAAEPTRPSTGAAGGATPGRSTRPVESDAARATGALMLHASHPAPVGPQASPPKHKDAGRAHPHAAAPAPGQSAPAAAHATAEAPRAAPQLASPSIDAAPRPVPAQSVPEALPAPLLPVSSGDVGEVQIRFGGSNWPVAAANLVALPDGSFDLTLVKGRPAEPEVEVARLRRQLAEQGIVVGEIRIQGSNGFGDGEERP